MKVPSNSSFPIKCKDITRHKMTSSFGFKEFEGSAAETEFWNKSHEEEKVSLKKRHVDTGECLLCMIDEMLPKKLHDVEKPKLVEVPKIQEQRESKKIIGGIIPRSRERIEVSTQNLKVSWAWHSSAQGLVAWTFQNLEQTQASCVLLRNSYYFGNAFWMIYESNPIFGTSFASKLEPLVENSIEKNSAPLGVISWKQPDGSYKNIVCFLFTLAPGQTWQMLEGGFTITSPPTEMNAFEVNQIGEDDFCIGYDKQQVSAWDKQTGNALKGYEPNPNTFHSVRVLVPEGAPFVQLFNDTIQQGKCESVAKETPAEEIPSQQNSSQSPSESRFWALLARNAGSLQ